MGVGLGGGGVAVGVFVGCGVGINWWLGSSVVLATLPVVGVSLVVGWVVEGGVALNKEGVSSGGCILRNV